MTDSTGRYEWRSSAGIMEDRNMENTKERVLALLEQVLPQIDFTTSADLIDDGILDSLSIVTMISELSMEFGIEFDMGELVPEDLNSLDSIVSLVDRLVSEQGK